MKISAWSLLFLGVLASWLPGCGDSSSDPGDVCCKGSPGIEQTWQSTNSLPGEGTVSFRVSVREQRDKPVSFHWQADVGVLGTPTETATTSEITWTSPWCISGGAPTISVTADHASMLEDFTHVFQVSGIRACPSWSDTGLMTSRRERLTASLLPSGKVLVAGGFTLGGGVLASAELYEPATGTWTTTGSMRTPRHGHFASVLPSGKVLVMGGAGEGGATPASAELYDPATGTWTATAGIALPRGDFTPSVLPSGKVLIIGGVDDTNAPIPSVQVFDPEAGTLKATGSMRVPRSGAVASVLSSGKVLVVGGDSLGSAEVYEPVTETWSDTGSMTVARQVQSAHTLPSGKVLVASGPAITMDLYDPATGTWSPNCPSIYPERRGFVVTLLPSGDILVTGGSQRIFAMGDSYVCDPDAGLWTRIKQMSLARRYHTATVLPSGQVLLSGGGYDMALDSAQLLSPGQ